MNIHLFGCKDTTLHLARFLKGLDLGINLVTISPELAAKNQVAGYEDLTNFPSLFSSIYLANSYSLDLDDVVNLTNSQELSLGFSIGWQRIMPKDLLEAFHVGVFGMHGSARDLPFGKGRSPLNWALLEGRTIFHTNLFCYDSGVDSGPILDSSTFSIHQTDTAETLHYKNTLSMRYLIEENIERLLNNDFKTRPQAALEGESFYPQRLPADSSIDWRDDIYNIERLVRSAGKPFDGAFSLLRGEPLVVERATIFYTDIESHPYRGRVFGEVVDVFPSEKFLVRCSGGVFLVHEFRGAAPSTGDNFEIRDSPSRRFKRNEYGFFDVQTEKSLKPGGE